MTPRIESLSETKLVGNTLTMSFANNKTQALWQSFMPRRKEIRNAVGSELYSIEIYSVDFFENFSPVREFEKWAAVKVADFNSIPESMSSLTIPTGLYAVFSYKGKPSKAQSTYQYIYGEWIPGSGYRLDNRPHFALMGDKYLGENDESEEEFWIPVRMK